MKHKKLFISLTAVFSVVVFFAVFLMIWYFGDSYQDFEPFRNEVEIPGLDEGAVPQGVATCPAEYYVERVQVTADGEEKKITEAKTQQYFFISAYMNDGSPSRIYVTGADTGYVGYVTMKTEKGEPFYGHCGGIAINNTTSPISTTSAKYYTLWVTGEGMVYCAKASNEFVKQKKSIAMEIIEKASRKVPEGYENGENVPEDYYSVQFGASFEANNRASFCFYYDDPSSSSVSSDKLFVGEFYRDGNYKTDDMHKLTTPEGYKNNAFMYEYNVTSSDSSRYGLYLIDKVDGLEESDRVPKIQKIYSIPEKIQGGSFSGKSSYSTNDGLLVLSQSYGLSNSHLLCFDVKTVMNTSKKYTDVAGESFKYNNVKKTFGDSVIDYTDPNLYVYYLDKNNEAAFVNDYSIPCMSEGLCAYTPSASSSPVSSRIYVLFESAGKKYKTFVRQQVKDIYSVIPKIK